MILIDIGEAEDKEYTAGIYMNEQGESLMYPRCEKRTHFLIRGSDGHVPLDGVAFLEYGVAHFRIDYT